jgi:UDP:flavonoid glycosyltransferase YjiC (YdhE family)
MKFLFCPLASYGFIYPAIGIAKTLYQRGHEVAFVTSLTFSEILRQAGLERIPRTAKDGPSFQVELWAEPLAIVIQVKHIEYALECFAPDVLVGHQLTIGPLIVRILHGLPVAVLGLAAYLWPASKSLLKRPPLSEGERLLVWRYGNMMEIYNRVCELFWLPLSYANYRETPLLGDLFLLQSVPQLEEDADVLPEKVHLIGSCLWEPPQLDAELSHWLQESNVAGEPVIYVQPGRSFQEPRIWPHLVDVLGNHQVRVVASISRMDGQAGAIPKNFFVRNHVSQGQVLPQVQAVISSGHTSAVLGALVHGLPSLLIPCGSGTEDIAERCQRAGAAICLSLSRVTIETLEQAMQTILNCPDLRQNAQALRQAFAKINGFEQAADLLEQLALTRRPVLR